MTDGNPYGIYEDQMFKDGIKKYIHVGNEKTHGTKKIFKQRKFKKLKFDWLVSRSVSKSENVIYIFE